MRQPRDLRGHSARPLGMPAFVLLLTLAGATDLQAISVTISLSSSVAEAAAPVVEILARPISGSAAAAAPQAVERCEGSCTVDLQTGIWRVSAKAPAGYWIAWQDIAVRDAPLTVALVAYPAAELTGTLTVERGTKAPATLRILLRPSDSAVKNPVGEIECPVSASGGKWSCSVPTGTFDIRLHAVAFASHYLWRVPVRRGETNDLGARLFRRGASFVGQVELARGVEKRTLIRATVALMPGGSTRFVSSAQQKTISRVVRPNEKGFFQIEGVAPGEYQVVAQLEELASDRRTVKILAEHEAVLREPLVLDTPKSVELTLSPPLDPAMKPWRVEVLEDHEEGRRVESIAQSASDGYGRWAIQQLRSGPYRFVVKSQDGDRWAEEQLTIDHSDVVRTIDIPMLAVDGTAKAAGKAIPADLTFIGIGGLSVRMHAGDDGAFTGFLPLRETIDWWVKVVSAPLHISRTLRSIEIRPDAEKRHAHVDIDVPSFSISGRVVGEDGSPIGRSIINVTPLEAHSELIQANGEKDGTFLLSGLAAEPYTIRAQSYDQRESDAVDVDPSADPGRELRLVVKPNAKLTILVVSDNGPVPGARVWAVSSDHPQIMVYALPTDAGGLVTHQLTPGTQEVDVFVSAPGFAWRGVHRHIEEPRIVVRVGQLAGVAEVHVPNPGKQELQPYILHEGTVFHASLFGTVKPDRDGKNVTFGMPNIEPGAYALCLAPRSAMAALRAGIFPADRCRTGDVLPGAQLGLDMTPH
ncbi:MAG TPA: carboxypeptidase-like regulatory domain-containing protein [Thermoanaerobaculia bacterium]|nr:carboxypeptidase-like regulatory domain-containing protein [Thermoanaerobaculia bacterium]